MLGHHGASSVPVVPKVSQSILHLCGPQGVMDCCRGVTEHPPSLWSPGCHRVLLEHHGTFSVPVVPRMSQCPQGVTEHPLSLWSPGPIPVTPGWAAAPQGHWVAAPISCWGHPLPSRVTPSPIGSPHRPSGAPITDQDHPPPLSSPQARWRCHHDPVGATRKASTASSSAVTCR